MTRLKLRREVKVKLDSLKRGRRRRKIEEEEEGGTDEGWKEKGENCEGIDASYFLNTLLTHTDYLFIHELINT